jgi:hypothetical protein
MFFWSKLVLLTAIGLAAIANGEKPARDVPTHSILLPCARSYVANSPQELPLRDASPVRAPFHRLRGGSPAEQSQVDKLNVLTHWMAEKWEEIPSEQRMHLQKFAVKLMYDKTGISEASPSASADSPAVKVAMMLLGLQVAMRVMPQWEDLWRRIERVLRSAVSSGAGNQDYAAVSTAVRALVEAFWSASLGAQVSIGSLECPSPGVVKVGNLKIGNPKGFSPGVDAISVDSISINLASAPELSRRALEIGTALLVVESLDITGLAVHLEFVTVKDILAGLGRRGGGHPKTNLEYFQKKLEALDSQATPQALHLAPCTPSPKP